MSTHTSFHSSTRSSTIRLFFIMLMLCLSFVVSADEPPAISMGDGTTFHITRHFTQVEFFEPPSPILFMAQGKGNASFIAIFHLIKGSPINETIQTSISFTINQKELFYPDLSNREAHSFDLKNKEGELEFQAKYFINNGKFYLLLASKQLFQTLSPDFQSMFSFHKKIQVSAKSEFTIWHFFYTSLLFLLFLFFILKAIGTYSRLGG